MALPIWVFIELYLIFSYWKFLQLSFINYYPNYPSYCLFIIFSIIYSFSFPVILRIQQSPMDRPTPSLLKLLCFLISPKYPNHSAHGNVGSDNHTITFININYLEMVSIGQYETERNATTGRKGGALSTVIPVIHGTSFCGISIG